MISIKQLHLDLIEELERGKEKKKKDYERGVFIKNSIRNGEIDPDILTEEHHKAMKTKKEFKMYFTYIIERNCIVNRYIFV